MLLRVVRISSADFPVTSAIETSAKPTFLASSIWFGVKGSLASLTSTSVIFLILLINHLSTLVIS